MNPHVEKVALSLWVHQCADASDTARALGEDAPHPGAGGDWFDIVDELGPVPDSFTAVASKALASVPSHVFDNGREAWLRLSGLDNNRFGHVVAMVLLGSGVGFSDDYRLSSITTIADHADVDTVERLRKALPRVGESCALFVEWDPNSRRFVA